MYIYYLYDGDTILHLVLNIKEGLEEKYLELLNNYLSELVFIDECESVKLIDESLIDDENKETMYEEDGTLFLEKSEVVSIENLDDNLPRLVKIKTKKYKFLRSFTITWLRRLLPDKVLSKSNNSYVPLLSDTVRSYFAWNCFEFKTMFEYFYSEDGIFKKDKCFDFKALNSLFTDLSCYIERRFSLNHLSWYSGIDDAEGACAEGIAETSRSNKQYLKKLGKDIKPYDNKIVIDI